MGICAFVGPLGPAPAQAQEQAHLPIVGRLFGTVGAEVRGGPVLDGSNDDLSASPVVGPRARLGLHHVLGQRLSMNAEAGLGVLYFGPHPIAFDGDAESRVAFNWSATVLARYMKIGAQSGWTFAGGVHYANTRLADGTLLQFGAEVRIGYNIWTGDERFLLIELGLHAPIIDGLSTSQQMVAEQQEVPGSWYQPMASLGIQWAF